MLQFFHTDSIYSIVDSLNSTSHDSLVQRVNDDGLQSDSIFVYQDSISESSNVKTLFTSHDLAVDKISPRETNSFSIDWITIHLIVAFGLLAWVRVFYRKRLRLIVMVFFSERNLGQLTREGNLFKERISIPLLIIYLITMSMFIYQLLIQFDFYPLLEYEALKLFSLILISVLFYWVSKYILTNFVGHVFKNYSVAYEYQLTNFIFTLVMGIILLPVVLMAVYYPSKEVVYFGLIIIGLSFIYRIGRESLKGIFFIKFSVFYKLLYLCTFEILPIVIFIKLVMRVLV